jgi:hypothetical protein
MLACANSAMVWPARRCHSFSSNGPFTPLTGPDGPAKLSENAQYAKSLETAGGGFQAYASSGAVDDDFEVCRFAASEQTAAVFRVARLAAAADLAAADRAPGRLIARLADAGAPRGAAGPPMTTIG